MPFDLEGQGQIPPFSKGFITMLRYIFGANLGALGQIPHYLSSGQAIFWSKSTIKKILENPVFNLFEFRLQSMNQHIVMRFINEYQFDTSKNK